MLDNLFAMRFSQSIRRTDPAVPKKETRIPCETIAIDCPVYKIQEK